MRLLAFALDEASGGSNAISGSTTQGDLDYVTILAPASIAAIVLTD